MGFGTGGAVWSFGTTIGAASGSSFRWASGSYGGMPGRVAPGKGVGTGMGGAAVTGVGLEGAGCCEGCSVAGAGCGGGTVCALTQGQAARTTPAASSDSEETWREETRGRETTAEPGTNLRRTIL